MQRKKNDVKARTTLLLSLLDEHQLRFSKYKTARELWAAILITFGGNEVTKKRKKNLLKQQYGNFKAEGSETLEQTFNRLQVIVSQLQFMDVEVEQDDLNQKFLTSLAPEWLMHTIVWTNMSDLETMSLDDLYNHLKVYESEVQKKSDPNSQNMAFISSSKHRSGNEDGNTTCVSTASTNAPTASARVTTISQDTASTYIASQSSGQFARECRAPRSQERARKDNYRQGSKAEEKTPKALMAIDGVGWDWSYMENKGEDHTLVADEEAPIEFVLMANIESKVFDNSLCSKDCKKKNDILNSKITDLTDQLFDANNYIYHYKLAVAHLEGRLVEYKEREVKYIEKIRTLEFYRESNKECIESLSKQLETLKLEKDGVDRKLVGLLKASKNLNNLIESQRSDKNKDRVRYIVVPPPVADLYLSPKKDLSWTGLPEFADDTVTDYSRPSPTIESTSEEGQNKNSSTSEDVASPITTKPFVKFVKPKDCQSKSKPNKKDTPKKPLVKYAEQYRKSNKKPNVRGNQRNWNNLKSYQLGPEFVLKKKACFKCGDFTHLANDCRKRVRNKRENDKIGTKPDQIKKKREAMYSEKDPRAKTSKPFIVFEKYGISRLAIFLGYGGSGDGEGSLPRGFRGFCWGKEEEKVACELGGKWSKRLSPYIGVTLLLISCGLQALSNLHYLFSGFMDYFWSYLVRRTTMTQIVSCSFDVLEHVKHLLTYSTMIAFMINMKSLIINYVPKKLHYTDPEITFGELGI
nr:hypothetical protein [Tanacetum cinerariifolium]GEY00353.1 hypothetical protein [Tanacetum cinerariifolium]